MPGHAEVLSLCLAALWCPMSPCRAALSMPCSSLVSDVSLPSCTLYAMQLSGARCLHAQLHSLCLAALWCRMSQCPVALSMPCSSLVPDVSLPTCPLYATQLSGARCLHAQLHSLCLAALWCPMSPCPAALSMPCSSLVPDVSLPCCTLYALQLSGARCLHAQLHSLCLAALWCPMSPCPAALSMPCSSLVPDVSLPSCTLYALQLSGARYLHAQLHSLCLAALWCLMSPCP